MKAVVVSRKDQVYVRDLESGDLVKLWSERGPHLYEVDFVSSEAGRCTVIFKEKERVYVGRRWWIIPHYELQPMHHVWPADNIVTVVTRLRVEQPK